MSSNYMKNISQCQSDLKTDGYTLLKLALPPSIMDLVIDDKYEELDSHIAKLTRHDGLIFKAMSNFCDVEEIEFIISLRDSMNEWEEDGIWHDDGSRILAFSLSLTLVQVEGGVLEFRKKGSIGTQKIKTPSYGTMIVFKTGVEGYEHKINAVRSGKRLIIAGWCYPSKSSSSL